MPVALLLSLSDDAPFAFVVCVASTAIISMSYLGMIVKWRRIKIWKRGRITKTLGVAVVIAPGFVPFV